MTSRDPDAAPTSAETRLMEEVRRLQAENEQLRSMTAAVSQAAPAAAPPEAPAPQPEAAPALAAMAPARRRSRKGRRNGSKTPRVAKQRKLNEDGLSRARMRYTAANIARCLEIVAEQRALAETKAREKALPKVPRHIAAALKIINRTPGLEKVEHSHLLRWEKAVSTAGVPRKLGGERYRLCACVHVRHAPHSGRKPDLHFDDTVLQQLMLVVQLTDNGQPAEVSALAPSHALSRADVR
jgi:hypothetical protein